MKLTYRTVGNLCVTDCPLNDEVEVGSSWCTHECEYCKSYDREKQAVDCTYADREQNK